MASLLRNAPKLLALRLEACLFVTDATLKEIGQSCMNLESLVLKHLENQITDIAVARMTTNLSALIELRLLGNEDDIRDISVLAITQHCRKLRILQCGIEEENQGPFHFEAKKCVFGNE